MNAIVFPGQGSQKPGMGMELYQDHEAARAVFAQVSEATGLDVTNLCFNTDEETLRRTENAQIALFTCGVAAWNVLRLTGVQASGTAGHSVGEYAALTAAGVLTVADGARLVQRRGELMAHAGAERPGTMAAVLGMEREALEALCAETEGVVVIANDNSPGQLVISGEVAAVEAASQAAKEKGAKRVIPLPVSGAFHSPLMREPARQMGEALRHATFSTPEIPVYANVTAAPEAEGWAELLERQLASPVRWTETILRMRADGFTRFIECGVGEVLSGLIRRIDREAEVARA
jgi:[acyl-carrier-protein] S-malonyltransferase